MQAVADVIKEWHIALLRTALGEMVARGPDQVRTDRGVCGNLNSTLRRMYGDAVPVHLGYDAVAVLAVGWAQAKCDWDGNLLEFFVPEDYYPHSRSHVPLWEGCQHLRRMDLLVYLLQRLELLGAWYMQGKVATAEAQAVKCLNGTNRLYLEQARDALLRIITGDLHNPEFGVCLNVNARIEQPREGTAGYNIMQHCATLWPKAVRADDGSARPFFIPREFSLFLWGGAQGELRREFCEFAIGCISAVLEPKESDDAQ